MGVKLILIRHGEYDKEKDELTKKGQEQVKKLAIKLADEVLETIYCSPAKRCIETLNKVLENREDGREIYMCSLIAPKKKLEELEKFKRRVKIFIDDLRDEFEEGEATVVAVSHKRVAEEIMEILGKEKVAIENGDLWVALV